MKILVSGGYGFIGSAFIRNHFKKNPEDTIINIDNLTWGSNLANLSEFENHKNYSFVKDDIQNSKVVNEIGKDVDVIVNFAAESHVDRSISNPKPFIETNVLGTYTLLESARLNDKYFVQISTDEIYGDAEDNQSFTENDLVKPSNPYSATKAAAEHLVSSYQRTYGLAAVITRCTNNFGPYQFPEKLIPKTIIRAMKGLKIPLYGGGNQIRSWIHVLDHVEAIESLIDSRKKGIFNITAWNEITNKSIVEKILHLLKKPNDLIEIVEDRPGHDKRYSIDASKIQQETGWKPTFDFDTALQETVEWFVHHKSLWEPMADEKTLHPTPWKVKWS